MQPFNYGMGGATRIRPADIATPGMFLTKNLTQEGINLAGESVQMIALKLTEATQSTDYSVTVNGYVVEFTTPATITMPDLQALLIQKLGNQPEVSGNFNIAASGTDSVILTAAFPGMSYAFSGTALITATQTNAPMSAQSVECGIILTGRNKFVYGTRVVGAPSSLDEPAIGATQYSHGMARELGQSGVEVFHGGDMVSLVSLGQGWMRFESIADLSVNGQLFYRSVPSVAHPKTGQLIYAASAPVGCVPIGGTLDSETSSIADGRIVGLVTLSLV